MGLKAIGTVVGRTEKTIEYVKDGKRHKFLSVKLFISDGGRPLEVVCGEENNAQQGEEVDLSCYIKSFEKKNGGTGWEIRESNGDA